MMCAIGMQTEPAAIAGGPEIAQWRAPCATMLLASWGAQPRHHAAGLPRSTPTTTTTALVGDSVYRHRFGFRAANFLVVISIFPCVENRR